MGPMGSSGGDAVTPGAPVSDADGLVVDPDPAGTRRIHLVGVAGTGMGSFAGMLKTAGYAVTGSDQNVYPPMSEMLAAWEIPVLTPFGPANLDAAKPDLVVIGNVIRRVNVEAAEVRLRRIPQTSFPAALAHYESAFTRFLRLIPTDGLLAVSRAYPNALRLARECPGRVVTYGGAVPGLEGAAARSGDAAGPAADYVARDVTLGPEGARFEVRERGRTLGLATLPVGGAHNVENALGVV